ncbi:hypothetical protein DOM22_09270 [Bdellovibrio sp. ZAP7]|uniref:hypothetical protein n=1 Tax=Bdellovibrio sp. ZAP7 TaxID=2231053 RepID=UPI001157ED4D|nr:hypothetical protein [Bdellovibrio sp. ZAP7]QDK45328.1 hypothetical protein DOM22_09270 [Bdellovibrio sp. ZAP7]
MPVSSLLVNFLSLMLLGFYLQRFSFLRAGVAFILKALLFSSLAWLVFTGAGYLFTPLYFDHAEVNIVSVASYWLQGHPIYTALQDPSRYSLLYGPWPYLVNAFFQSSGLSVLVMGKIPGVLNLSILLAAFYLSIKQIGLSRSKLLLALGTLSVVLLGYYNFSYWNRPDSYLTAYAFLALFVVLMSDKLGVYATYGLLGLLCGLSANCKLHGVLYFVPAVVFYLEMNRTKVKLLPLLCASVLAVFGLLMPFLLNNVGAENYFAWIEMASKHGLVMKDFVKNLTFIGSFLIFIYLLGFQRKYRWTFIALVIVSVVVALAASKPGAGPHHFMPLLPLVLYFAVDAYFSMGSQERSRLNFVVAAFLLTVSLNGVNRQKRVAALFQQTIVRKEELLDFSEVLNSTEGKLEVGYSEVKNYESSFLKVVSVAKERGLLLDGAALMDMKASGLAIPQETIESIKNCSIPNFVFPKDGEPWGMTSFYGHKPLFDEEFKEAFHRAYLKERESKFYSLYKCREGLR